MEVKLRPLSQTPKLRFLQSSSSSLQCCCPHPSKLRLLNSTLFSTRSSVYKHIHALPLRRRLQEISTHQDTLEKKSLIHSAKVGERLNSISKMYGPHGVCTDAIAACDKAIDIDLAPERKQLNIPSSASADDQMCQFERSVLSEFNTPKMHKSSLSSYGVHLNHKLYPVLASHPLPNAKASGCFLVLVPLVALCVRFAIGAFHHRVAGGSRQGARVNHDRSQNRRWKYVLSDTMDSDTVNLETSPDSSQISEDQDQFHTKERPGAYIKLERDYEKFLSECGISKSGYWRGGSPV